MNWKIHTEDVRKESVPSLGNRFLTGNGYMGVRGTLEEYTKEQLPAVNLAGIFDQVGSGWREPLNAPNGLYTYISADEELLTLPDRVPAAHEMELDYRNGLFSRKTSWKTARGTVTVSSERFVSRDEVHLIAMRYVVTADFHADIVLHTGIDGRVWEINGPHYDRIDQSVGRKQAQMTGYTHEKGDRVTVMEQVVTNFLCAETDASEKNLALHRYEFVTEPGKEYRMEKAVVVYTSNNSGWGEAKAAALLEEFREAGGPERSGEFSRSERPEGSGRRNQSAYEDLRYRHQLRWEEKWKHSEVKIVGDPQAMEALNYSIYHLLSIAPAHADSMSIPARGLSGQTYKGAVFWDTEMFMLDFFLLTDPAVAKTLMKYRVDTLDGARKKAQEYGYEGAYYAWESQEGGFDACSDYNVVDVFTGRPMRTYFRDKQYHISAAIVHGIMRYTQITGDDSLLREGGFETVIECARFYYSLLLKRAGKERYEIHDVIGPDEYHERVNNNAYTNRMAKYVLETAAELLEHPEQYGASAGNEMESGRTSDSGNKTESGRTSDSGNKTEDSRTSDSGNKTEDSRTSDPGNGRIPELDKAQSPFFEEEQAAELRNKFREAADHLYLPSPDGDGVIPQFDGYEKLEDVSLKEVRSRLLHEKEYWGGAYGVASHTKVIKQADVVTMLNLFSDEYPKEIWEKNWDYYEPRTEHGSSLSACMYAILACKCGKPERAYPFFMKSARADLDDGGKEWAGLIYIGGTHPAASGGAYMTAIEGFGGLHIEKDSLKLSPQLPEQWEELCFDTCFRGRYYHVKINRSGIKVTEAEA